VIPALRALGLGDLATAVPALRGRGPESHRLLQEGRPDELWAFANAETRHPDGPEWTDDEHEAAWLTDSQVFVLTAPPAGIRPQVKAPIWISEGVADASAYP
jgi:hypothetical protein